MTSFFVTKYMSKSLWESKSFKNSLQRVQMIDILLKYIHPLIWILKRFGCPKWFRQKFCHKKSWSSRTIVILKVCSNQGGRFISWFLSKETAFKANKYISLHHFSFLRINFIYFQASKSILQMTRILFFYLWRADFIN